MKCFLLIIALGYLLSIGSKSGVLGSSQATWNIEHCRGNAYYILFADDVLSPTFPEGFTQYELFIVQPQNFTAAIVNQVRTAIPGAKLVAYWDFQDVPIKSGCSTGHVMGDKPGRTCSSYPTYHCGDGNWGDAIQAGIPAEYAVNELFSNGTKSVICLYPGLALYVPFKASVDAMVDVIINFFQTVPLDGIYLDGAINAELFATSRFLKLNGTRFDCNGDGKADTFDQLVSQYAAYGPYFIAQLRARLGPNAIMLGNSAGSISDSHLNGITIEMEACVDPESCTNALMGQYDVSAQPPVSVLWLTHAEVMPPEEQCEQVALFQKEMPWILAGTDFFDGSHIVCNNTRRFY